VARLLHDRAFRDLVVIPTVVGTITNTARASSTAPDPNLGDNGGTVETAVIPIR
jgi:hypothetical protein